MITWDAWESHRRACQSRRAQRRQIARNGTLASRAHLIADFVSPRRRHRVRTLAADARARARVSSRFRWREIIRREKKEEQHEKQEV